MCSFVDVLYQRYADGESEDSSYELFIVGNFSPGKCGNQLTVPPALALSRCDILQSGNGRVIRECCKEVEELDLASNKLTDLNQVFAITKEMPFLKFLNLSENDLSAVDVTKINPVQLQSVRSLVLNNTGVRWRTVALMLDQLPALQELHLSLNNYESVDLPDRSYPNVRRIYISKNPALRCWRQIGTLLAAFPRLQCLSMADCGVDTIPDKLGDLLPCVSQLNISNWPLECWKLLERLNQLPKLLELRCQGLRLLQHLESTELRRQLIIARFPGIRRLNGSEISDDERLHAERAFIRYYTQNPNLPKPPRFDELFSIYGNVAPLAEVDLSPPKHADVKVTFHKGGDHLNKENNEKVEQRKMKLDLKKSVKDLKAQLSCMFSIPVNKMRLYYIDSEMVEITGPEELKFNQKKLYTYNIQDGDEFLVDEK